MKIGVNVISIALIMYSILQIYGLNIKKEFDPILSFIEKESNVNFLKLDNTNEVFESISRSKNVTMIDLWAYWCVACKELDKYTFSDQRVYKSLNKINIIKFDVTENNTDHSKFLSDYKIYGPPALMFFDNNGTEIKSARMSALDGYVDIDKEFV